MQTSTQAQLPRYALALSAVLLAATGLHAQSFTTQPCKDNNDGGGMISHWLSGGDGACELRSTTFPLANGRLAVRSLNGGIDVIGEDRQDIGLEARVSARAGSPSDAASLLHAITIQTGGTVEAKGPKTSGGRGWSVSYRLRVPRHLAADLQTTNGGVSLTALDGDIHAETTNGSLALAELAGDIHASTTNGSIKATLSGSTWRGRGLSASTTNGAVSVTVPPSYSAHLVANTVNGGTSLNAPGANNSHISRREIDTTFGSGGPTLTFETVNGGVSVQ